MKIELCLPIKNEEQILDANLLAVIKYIQDNKDLGQVSLVAVVNGSSDSSLDIVKKIQNDNKEILRYIKLDKGGKGRAIKTAWSSSKADVLAFMDIDLVVPLEFLRGLFKAIVEDGYDLAIASRYFKASQVERSFLRKLVSRVYIYLSKAILRHPYSDLQCGFKAIDRDKFAKLYPYLSSDDWFFDTELLIYAKLQGLRVKEIAVDWQEKKNKLRKSNIKIFKDAYIFLGKTLALRKDLKKLRK